MKAPSLLQRGRGIYGEIRDFRVLCFTCAQVRDAGRFDLGESGGLFDFVIPS